MPIVFEPRTVARPRAVATRAALLHRSRALMEGSQLLIAMGATQLQLSRERIHRSTARADVNAWACRRRADPNAD